LPVEEPKVAQRELAEVSVETSLSPTQHITIKPGSSLWALSRELYGAGRHYVILFQANKTQIQDPRLIYPGQVLAAPKQMDN
jgi:nucleoid-associated protein YgaU